MNLLTFIISCLAIFGLAWGAMNLRRMSQDQERSDEDRKVFIWGFRGLAVMFVFGVLVTVLATGLVNIPDPFQGKKVGNTMPTHAMPLETVVSPPELSGVRIQPDVDAAVSTHKEQLKDFEQN